MRILVVSDTHGRTDGLEEVLKKIGKIDMLIHLGDVIDDADYIQAIAPCPCYIVRGNCDFDVSLPPYEVVQAGKHRIFCTHGHAYDVGYGNEFLIDAAKDRGCDIALYGHTHIPDTEYGEVCVGNPGSLSRPRQEGGRRSYMILEFDQHDTPFFNINYL